MAATTATLPPGPSIAPRRQELAWVLRPEWLMERAAAERGDMFTLRLPIGPVVMLSDPAAIKEVFTGDPETLRAGEGNQPLEPVVGPESLLLLDGARHLRRRRLVLPPFHGDRLAAYERDMARLAAEDIETWPLGEPFSLEQRMRAITLAVIVRVVFGIEDEGRAAALRELIPRLLPDGGLSTLVLLPAFRRDLGPWSPWQRFLAARAQVDALLFEEIASRREDPGLAERADVLSLLLQARDTSADASRSPANGEDGEPLTDRELRDELMTLVLAGHETTATALAWTFELLFRRPDALERATAEARAGGPTEWLDAVGAEALRLKPPLPMAVRRASRPVTVGGTELPEGTRIGPCIYLTHRRPDLYPQPRAFRPERFLDERVSNYAWLPFGGGIRRCVGAAFAQLELRTILRTVLERAELRPASGRPARTRRRAIVLAPSNGAEAVLVSRD